MAILRDEVGALAGGRRAQHRLRVEQRSIGRRMLTVIAAAKAKLEGRYRGWVPFAGRL